jgi:hypothetical protein
VTRLLLTSEMMLLMLEAAGIQDQPELSSRFSKLFSKQRAA